MKSKFYLAPMALVIGWSSAASAQSAPEEDRGQIQDIVVTAQKQAAGESAQKVPVAITAVSGDTLVAANAMNISDAARLAPSATLQQPATVPGFANFAIRGIGSNGSSFSIDPAVNIIVDGMVYDFQAAVIIDTFDAETVELLRGPQGILFGKNTTGGAVSVRTKRPTNSLSVAAQASYGNYDRVELSGLVSGPIVTDTLLGKISVMYRKRDTYFTDRNGGTFVPSPNNPLGTEPGTVRNNDGEETFVVRPTLVWKPSSNVDLNLYGEYVKLSGGANASQPTPGLAGNLLTKFGYTPPAGKFEINANIGGYLDSESWRGVAELNVDVGAGVFTSVSGYRHVDYKTAVDLDGAPFSIIEFPFLGGGSEQFSQEIRFASTFSDTVKFTVGAYYDYYKFNITEQRFQSSLVSNPSATISTIQPFQSDFRQRADSTAIFGNVDFSVTPELTLTAGGRFSWDKKQLSAIPLSLCTNTSFTNCPSTYTDITRKWNNFSPKLGVTYQISDDTMVYASWTKGFRSGNFNNRATSVANLGPANPETVQSFEGGLKTTFWDRKARINVSVYRTKYDDIQRLALLGAVQTLTNAASADITGAELELTLKPVPALQLDASLGYIDPKYKRFDNINLNGIPGIQPEDGELAKKLKFDRVPKITAYGAITYTLDVPGITNGITARVDYSYRSKFFSDVNNTPLLLEKGYGLLGANLTADWDKFRVSLWGRNLTNTRWAEFSNTTLIPVRKGGEPRTYGITIGYKY